jgi:hypothetical protein
MVLPDRPQHPFHLLEVLPPVREARQYRWQLVYSLFHLAFLLRLAAREFANP